MEIIMRALPVRAISEVDPFAERTRRYEHNSREIGYRHPQYILNFSPPFYLEPRGFDFSSFVSPEGEFIVPKTEIIDAYLSQFKDNFFLTDDLREEDISPKIERFLLPHIGPVQETERTAFIRQLKSRAEGIYLRAIQQRNQEVAGLISEITSRFNPLEGEFFVMGHNDFAENPDHQRNHRTPQDLRLCRNPNRYFPQRVTLKIGAPGEDGKRDFSLNYSRESFGDYCIWMRPANAFRDVTSYVSNLGFN